MVARAHPGRRGTRLRCDAIVRAIFARRGAQNGQGAKIQIPDRHCRAAGAAGGGVVPGGVVSRRRGAELFVCAWTARCCVRILPGREFLDRSYSRKSHIISEARLPQAGKQGFFRRSTPRLTVQFFPFSEAPQLGQFRSILINPLKKLMTIIGKRKSETC